MAFNQCKFCGRPGRFYKDEPRDYVFWHLWADEQSKTHHQEECPGCGHLTVWKLNAVESAKRSVPYATQPTIIVP